MPIRKNNPLRNLILVAVVVALLGFLGLLKPITQPLTRLVSGIAAPFYSAGAALSRGAHRLFAPDNTPSPETQALIDQLREDNAKLREFAVENAVLKTALDYRERTGLEPLTARVVSETDADVFHGLVIDRGYEDGVRQDQAVIVGDGVIIGKIFEVRDRTASVLLLSDSKSRLAVTVQQTDGTAGVLEGDRGLSMVIDLIPQTVAIAAGDTVVTSGIESGIRRGLVVGVIDKVTQHSQDPFQSATVVPMSSALRPPLVQVIIEDVEAAEAAAKAAAVGANAASGAAKK